MPDLLQRGSDWLADKLKTHASREVVYQRAAQQVTVQAIIGRKDFEADTAVRVGGFLPWFCRLCNGYGEALLKHDLFVEFGDGFLRCNDLAVGKFAKFPVCVGVQFVVAQVSIYEQLRRR